MTDPRWIASKMRSELTREAKVQGWTMPRGWEDDVMIVVQRVLDEEKVALYLGSYPESPIRLF